MQEAFSVDMEVQSQAAQDASCPCALQVSACPPAASLAFTLPQMCTLAAGQELSGDSQKLSWQESR